MKALTKAGVLIVAALVLAGTAPAAMYNYTGSTYDIPDGSVMGVFSQINVIGAQNSLSHIAVTLDVSGGYNGDLYAYLSYGSVLVPLLNRIGVSSGNAFGSSGAAMNVILSDSGAVNIHAAGDGPLSSTYRPDGQNISPVSSASSFNASGGSIMLDAVGTGFGNMNPNGTWTLYFADVSGGGDMSTLNGCSLNIEAVPEPVNAALGVFAAFFLIVILARSRPVRSRLHRCYFAAVDWINAV